MRELPSSLLLLRFSLPTRLHRREVESSSAAVVVWCLLMLVLAAAGSLASLSAWRAWDLLCARWCLPTLLFLTALAGRSMCELVVYTRWHFSGFFSAAWMLLRRIFISLRPLGFFFAGICQALVEFVHLGGVGLGRSVRSAKTTRGSGAPPCRPFVTLVSCSTLYWYTAGPPAD